MPELVQLPRLMSVSIAGRKTYRNRCPAHLVDMDMVKSTAAKLKKSVDLATERINNMPKETDREKKVVEVHQDKLDLMKKDLSEFEALLGKQSAPAPVKAKKGK
jgi:nitrate/TMAO reductase-like tetraheme cytochrome c subunit